MIRYTVANKQIFAAAASQLFRNDHEFGRVMSRFRRQSPKGRHIDERSARDLLISGVQMMDPHMPRGHAEVRVNGVVDRLTRPSSSPKRKMGA